ncbi:MAG TPA: hypothetical protein VNB95_02825 [Nitrososphaera sp.]|nr:hypothetical protein [Nitrososphaera sp.]
MPTTTRYLYIGAITLAASGAVAIYLDLQAVKCMSDLAQVDRSVITLEHLEEMEENCSIITNSYVYSVYGVIVGITLIVIGLVKKRKSMHAF